MSFASLEDAQADPAPVRTISVSSTLPLSGVDLKFPTTEFGSNASTAITVTNDGPDPLTISQIDVKGYGKADYAISASTCNSTPMPEGSSCSFTLTFTPTFDGNNVAALIITSDATAGQDGGPGPRSGITPIFLKGFGYGVCGDNPFAGGSGTDVDPFVIQTIAEFNCINATTNEGAYRYLDSSFLLDRDLDTGGVSGAMWPVGTWDDTFTGSFNGGGHVIHGFTVDDVWSGLFAWPSAGAHIFNLTLSDANVTSIFEGGILASYSDGVTFEDIRIQGGSFTGTQGNTNGGALGYVYDSTIDRLSSSATVSVTARENFAYVGGLIGQLDAGSEVSQSSSTGAVTVTYERADGVIPEKYYAGGLVGQMNGGDVGGVRQGSPVSNSFATGSVSMINDPDHGYVGGFAGYIVDTDTVVSRSYATGAVSGTGLDAVSGFVGRIGGGGAVVDSFWDTETSGQATDAAPTGTTGLTSAQMRSLDSYSSWNAPDVTIVEGWIAPSSRTTQVWGMCSDVASGLPFLQWERTTSCPEAPIPTPTPTPTPTEVAGSSEVAAVSSTEASSPIVSSESSPPYRQPALAQPVTGTVTLVSAKVAASTPTRVIRREPSATIGSAPVLIATVNQPLKLVVSGFTPGGSYEVQIKSGKGYVTMGSVTANADGQLQLPVFRATKPTETTIAIVSATGKASYLKVSSAKSGGGKKSARATAAGR